jgi:glutamate--cysteine ligase
VALRAVSEILQARLARLANAGAAPLFAQARRGVEKESLRVAPDGYIAATPHPRALGSALTNAYITTDFSEALLEFVTPPLGNGWEVIQFLCDLHQFAQSALGDEVLWCMSMPCMIRSDADIPLARYGSSNVGTMKTVYRRGLGYRYGRYMQAISGVHFNYSLPEAFWPLYAELRDSSQPLTEFRSAAYLGLVRNVRRLDWLLLYLFGASPAVCKSFLRGRSEGLEEFDGGTVYGPWATSLRMSDIGYQNTSQARLEVSANSLDEYIRDLSRATRSPNAAYERTGVLVDGVYRQLSANQLQIENEYYSTIRPKRVAFSGERPTAALARGGIEYVELRALDVSPFDPVGVHESQMRFLEVFLVCCLLSESPPIDDAEQAANARNHVRVARSGRAPGLTLVRDGRDMALEQWARETMADMQAVAEFMDPADAGGYRSAVDQQLECVNDPSRIPSARLLSELRETGLPLFTYAMQLSRSHAEYFAALDPATNVHWQLLTEEARDSLQRQAAIEAADELSFDEYLRRYFA